jgi:RNA polymerase sigma-70 factor (ECF subfamily)
MDESRLVELARGGDEQAVRDLFSRVWPLAWQWAYGVVGDRSLADQTAQTALSRAFASLDRFDPERPFRPWLKRITINVAIDEFRRERRRAAATEEWLSELRAVAPPDDDEARLLDELLVDAVRSLPARQRLVVALHYWLDCGVEEIASLLDIPVGTVVSRLSRARAVHREQLEEEHAS